MTSSRLLLSRRSIAKVLARTVVVTLFNKYSDVLHSTRPQYGTCHTRHQLLVEHISAAVDNLSTRTAMNIIRCRCGNSFCDYSAAIYKTFRLTDLLNDDPARKPVTRTAITTATGDGDDSTKAFQCQSAAAGITYCTRFPYELIKSTQPSCHRRPPRRQRSAAHYL